MWATKCFRFLLSLWQNISHPSVDFWIREFSSIKNNLLTLSFTFDSPIHRSIPTSCLEIVMVEAQTTMKTLWDAWVATASPFVPICVQLPAQWRKYGFFLRQVNSLTMRPLYSLHIHSSVVLNSQIKVLFPFSVPLFPLDSVLRLWHF